MWQSDGLTFVVSNGILCCSALALTVQFLQFIERHIWQYPCLFSTRLLRHQRILLMVSTLQLFLPEVTVCRKYQDFTVLELKLWVTIASSFVVFQEDSSSQEKETKGTVWQLEQVFAYFVKSSSAVCVAVCGSHSEWSVTRCWRVQEEIASVWLEERSW
jgi:hypothetical protein